VSERPDCRAFEERGEELALGLVGEPERRALLAHADGCLSCRTLLTDLQAVSDEMLLLAPDVDAPPGFAERTVAAMTGAPVRASVASKRWPVLAGAAAAILFALGLVVGGLRDGRGPTEVASGPLVTADGASIGQASIVRSERLLMLVEIDDPQDFEGRRTCILVEPDGTRTEVGGWTAAGIATGAWSIAIDDDLADAERMEVLNDDGEIVSTVSL
jgi:hypothetical protein